MVLGWMEPGRTGPGLTGAERMGPRRIGSASMAARRILVTGGVGSGKSRYAEDLLAHHPHVTYIAPGPVPDPQTDPEWAARIAAHRSRRPDRWTTVEAADVATAVRAAAGPVLIDCLGTWLMRLLDDLGAWEEPRPSWEPTWNAGVDDLLSAWRGGDHWVVAVSNEVGWGVVPAYESGRLFADLLGRLNQRVAAASDEVILMVAGRALHL
jgi:adenosylcobinamide kinase/adenosylcobinamide-phosphate guanylyltransferase